jgi:protein-disulfide isomerase
MRRLGRPLFWLLALTHLASCRSSTPAKAPVAVAAPAPPDAGGGPPADCSSDFPGLPLSDLPLPARLEFCKFAQDTFCYCHCPHLLAGCLRDHPSCPHASRMAALAMSEIASGQGAEKAGEFVTAYYDSFKKDARTRFDLAGIPCQGSAEAPITVIEFSDFDCPHCKAMRPVLEGLVQGSDDVRLCFISFPLHPHSALAAAAATYAYSKGAFWKYHDLLFQQQDARVLKDEAGYVAELKKLGAQAGLDEAGLDQAIHDPKLLEAQQQQKEAGKRLGIDGTPYIYVNGRPAPPLSAEILKLTVQDEREWIAHGGAWAQD